MNHPYSSLPASSFWKRSIAAVPAGRVDPVVSGKFKIGRTDRVVTAGSCFAQHIARYLQKSGFNYYVTENAPGLVPPDVAEAYGYGMFSARYGNIYTSRQLLQTLMRAYDMFHPAEDRWVRPDGRIVDPFRPHVQPNGFASLREYEGDRRHHLQCVRRAVEELDVFVFTLGLTETWASRVDGAVFPLCPGVAGGTFDPGRHKFVNLRVPEVIDDLRESIAFIRARNPAARFILTVSPVPLIATAEPRSVLVATTYSKSVLRVAAQDVADAAADVAYFPSYEIITGPHARGMYFADDLRSVTEDGVRQVHGTFHAALHGGA